MTLIWKFGTDGILDLEPCTDCLVFVSTVDEDGLPLCPECNQEREEIKAHQEVKEG